MGRIQVINIKDQKTVVRGQGLNYPHGISLRYHLPGLPRYDLMELPTTLCRIDLTGWCTSAKRKVRSIKFPASGWNFMLNTNDILGMAKMKGGVKILLYIDRVLSAEEKTL